MQRTGRISSWRSEIKFLKLLIRPVLAEVFVPAPSWVSYPAHTRMLNRLPTTVTTSYEDKWKLNTRNIRPILDSTNPHKLLVLNYPSNPTGLSYSHEEFQQIAPLLQQTNTVTICDEIYSDLYFEALSLPSLAQHLPDYCIIASGLSKGFGAGGWRLGYMVFPPALMHIRQAVTALASETFSCAPTPMQHAAISVFQPNDNEAMQLQQYHRQSRSIMQALGRECTRRFNYNNIRCHTPHGGFYLYPDFSHYADVLANNNVMSASVLCDRLLIEQGVCLLPGTDFGASNVGSGSLQARVCFVDFDGAAALQHYASIAVSDLVVDVDVAFLQQHCGKVLEAVDRVCSWVRQLA